MVNFFYNIIYRRTVMSILKKQHYSREYKKMMRKYRKEAIEIAKECAPWDWCWSQSFIVNHLKWMRDYYANGENVVAVEDCTWKDGVKLTRLEMIDEILAAIEDFENLDFFHEDFHSPDWECLSEQERKERRARYHEKYCEKRHKVFELLEKYYSQLWD